MLIFNKNGLQSENMASFYTYFFKKAASKNNSAGNQKNFMLIPRIKKVMATAKNVLSASLYVWNFMMHLRMCAMIDRRNGANSMPLLFNIFYDNLGGITMAEYEKDYIMRVTKTAVKGLNVFLKADSVDAIMHVDEAQTGQKKEKASAKADGSAVKDHDEKAEN